MGKYKKLAGVYMILCSTNKKVYVGYSETIRRRWDAHKHHLRRNLHTNKHLQNSWNKYGESAFIFSFLEIMPSCLPKQEYETVETKWVNHFKSCEKEHGYNKCLPGSIPTKETKSVNPKPSIKVVCINTDTEEVIIVNSYKEVAALTEVPLKKVSEYCAYWTNPLQKTHRSYKGWIMVKETMYDTSINYITFKKPYKKYNTKNNN